MTVVMVGVGSDSDHARPPPKLNEDGSYEYIPIPETWLTIEERTYRTFQLDHQEGYATDLVEKIRPF